MALKTFVKIGKISNLSDARYCSGMMVDVLGFNLNPEDQDYISPEVFSEITNWVTGVSFAGEFGDLDHQSLINLLPSYNVDVIEVTNTETLLSLANIDQKKYLKLSIENANDIKNLDQTLKAVKEHCERVSVFCKDEKLIPQIEKILDAHLDMNLLKGFGLVPGKISNLDSIWSGIVLEGSPEEQPGFKDYGIVMDILEELEED